MPGRESGKDSWPEKDITGVRVTGGRVFLQNLEGPTQSVLGLYLRFLQDRRHNKVDPMCVTPIVDRLFGNWSMGLPERTPLQFQEVLQFKTAFFAREDPQEYIGALRGLIKMLKARRRIRMGLHQIIYVSTLADGARHDLPAIIETSVKNNHARGLTGMLLYADGNVMQVLEGEGDVLRQAFQRIERDPRHYGVVVLVNKEIESRQFEAWSMGYRAISASELKALPIAEQIFKCKDAEIEQRVRPGAALAVLKTFMVDPRTT